MVSHAKTRAEEFGLSKSEHTTWSSHNMTDERATDLEIRLAFLEDSLTTLDLVVQDLGDSIDAIRREMADLREAQLNQAHQGTQTLSNNERLLNENRPITEAVPIRPARKGTECRPKRTEQRRPNPVEPSLYWQSPWPHFQSCYHSKTSGHIGVESKVIGQ